jgi:small subunit ribosomal protein S4
MSKTVGPKCKKCRRAGEKLFLRGERCSSPKCAMVKRNYPPGIHGPKGYPRSTSFGSQLKEKQNAKRMYGLTERQFHGFYEKAVKKRGNSGDILLQLLETRLDNVIYRLGFAKSRKTARQLINHGHFLINNKKVNIPSYKLKVNDEISVNPQSLKKTYFNDLIKILEKHETVSWIKLDKKSFKAKILSLPQGEELPKGIQTQLIIEFYSR